ncbi:MAG: hypothetical protein M3253_01030, partial [Chloroflexota bacterium]|nr:hypothetical protein [Chloroflexota bacterium]
ELFDMFQTPARSAGFKVGRLSFRVLDTRLERTADRSRFTTPEELAALDAWVSDLDGPGALVLGQPIFATQAGPKGHLFDWGLPDFDQYGELVRILQRSRHDLLVLTGDVHYGRISGCRLPSGASLIEIIASPFALVSGFFGGKWQPPPGVFPPLPVPGATQPAIWVEESHRLATNQFATLEFCADGPRVRLSVRAWQVPDAGVRPESTQVFQRLLE